MSKSLQAIRGMNDILPEQTPLWRYFEGTVARLLDNYGYKQIRMPIVEFTELFKRSISIEQLVPEGHRAVIIAPHPD
ncbi:hypothetical protein Q6257_29910, partial [Klebsiella variicola]|nr:hypothetical protein [Klebsiella variicola]